MLRKQSESSCGDIGVHAMFNYIAWFQHDDILFGHANPTLFASRVNRSRAAKNDTNCNATGHQHDTDDENLINQQQANLCPTCET